MAASPRPFAADRSPPAAWRGRSRSARRSLGEGGL